MGLLIGIMQRFKRKEIEKFVAALRESSSEEKAALLILAYVSSGIPLIPSEEVVQRMRAMGITDEIIEGSRLKVFHYNPGNQTPLLQLIDDAKKEGFGPLCLGLRVHEYTNMATAYAGFDHLVREMWSVLFEGSESVEQVFTKNHREPVQYCRVDLPLAKFLQDPKTITPHFFLLDSPITKHIERIKTIGGQILGRKG